MADENVFTDKYDLLRKLGEGGMAEIYLARQRGLGGFQKELVIKRIHRELAKNERYVELFLDEARIAANLNHPNIVHIYDIGKAYGTYYIAMEYIQGADLMDICRRGIREKKFLPIKHGVKIISQVAEGLGFAHAYRDPQGQHLGIVHRDISPSNIIVSYSGLAKLVDFGIAKAATQVHDDSGKVMGKLNYMAPEQLKGEGVDNRSDLFALGVVLYEVTAGKRLFRGAGEEVARKILEEPIPPPSLAQPEYPPDLEVILMRLLEKKPENRYQDAQELHLDLEEFLAESGAKTGKPQISRYLVDLYDLDGVPLDVEYDAYDEEDDDELALERPAGGFDDDFAEEPGGEVIFASRMEDSFSGGSAAHVSGEHAVPTASRSSSGGLTTGERPPTAPRSGRVTGVTGQTAPLRVTSPSTPASAASSPSSSSGPASGPAPPPPPQSPAKAALAAPAAPTEPQAASDGAAGSSKGVPAADAPLPVLTGLFSSPSTPRPRAAPIINPLAEDLERKAQAPSGSLTWLWVVLGVLGVALAVLLTKLLGVF